MRWTVVIPTKGFPGAKSRLAPASADPAAHRRLVEAIRADTVAAARTAQGVARVLLVVDAGSLDTTPETPPNSTDGPDGPDVDMRIVQVRPGLNGALRDGAEHAARCWPEDGVAALVGDLPALRPDELADTLRAAEAGGGAGFVADASGTGTTMLAAAPGRRFEPRFGTGSAARHGADLPALPAGAGLRRDVDTAADLQAAAADPGLGPHTARVLAGAARPKTPPVLQHRPSCSTARRTATQVVQLPLR